VRDEGSEAQGEIAPHKSEKDAAPPATRAAPPPASAPPPSAEASRAYDDVAEAPARAAKKSRRPPSGHFTFSETRARGGERLGYSADGYSVIISIRDDAPAQLLADNSQRAINRGTFVLAPASGPRHERVLLFVMSEPFDAASLLAAVSQQTAGEATAAIELSVAP
jgi:hypothetical protein